MTWFNTKRRTCPVNVIQSRQQKTSPTPDSSAKSRHTIHRSEMLALLYNIGDMNASSLTMQVLRHRLLSHRFIYSCFGLTVSPYYSLLARAYHTNLLCTCLSIWIKTFTDVVTFRVVDIWRNNTSIIAFLTYIFFIIGTFFFIAVLRRSNCCNCASTYALHNCIMRCDSFNYRVWIKPYFKRSPMNDG